MSKMKTTVVSFEEFTDDEWQAPTTYYVRTATEYLFIHSRDRHKCQEYVDENYGQGKYLVRASKLVQPKGELSAKGYVGAKSRAGSRCVK